MTLIKIFKIIIILFLVLNLSILIAGYSIYKSEINNLNLKTEKKLEILSRKSDELDYLLNIEKTSYRDKKAQIAELQTEYDSLLLELITVKGSPQSAYERKKLLEVQDQELAAEINNLQSQLSSLNAQLNDQLLAARSSTTSSS